MEGHRKRNIAAPGAALMLLPYEIRFKILAHATHLPEMLNYWCFCQKAPESEDSRFLHYNEDHDEWWEAFDSWDQNGDSGHHGMRVVHFDDCTYGLNCGTEQGEKARMILCEQCMEVVGDYPMCPECREYTMRTWLALMLTSQQLNREAKDMFVRRSFRIRIFRSTIRFGNWRDEQALQRMSALRIWNARYIEVEFHEPIDPDTHTSFKAICEVLKRQGGEPEMQISFLKIKIYLACLQARTAQPKSTSSDQSPETSPSHPLKKMSQSLAGLSIRKLEVHSQLYWDCHEHEDSMGAVQSELAMSETGTKKANEAQTQDILDFFIAHFEQYRDHKPFGRDKSIYHYYE